jgi:ADP-ribose pyrophosphatase
LAIILFRIFAIFSWKRDANGAMIYRRMNAHDRLKPVLEFVAIQRHDTKQWALPGVRDLLFRFLINHLIISLKGMVDPGENITETVKREFHEEAASEGLDETSVKRLFSNGFKLYESYVDDPRNTDNAWMETVAM